MSIWKAITGLFGSKSAHEAQLRQAMAFAKERSFNEALQIYNSLIASPKINADIRAQALFNRALAHSAERRHKEARLDLERILADPAAPANVQSAARLRLQRVVTRSERGAKSSSDDSSVE
jgi:hypothetical protein